MFKWSLMVCALTLLSCGPEEDHTGLNDGEAGLTFEFDFNESLPRLDNLGNPVDVGVGNAAQHPKMKEVSCHYIELAQDSLTVLGDGEIVYHAAETNAGGSTAVDFDQAIKSGEREPFLRVKLSNVAPGTYEWLRVSLTYQKYDIDYHLEQPPFINGDFQGTLSSFVGFNTFITEHTIDDSTIAVNENKLQGFWMFETSVDVAGNQYGAVSFGQSSGTTVVNPIALTSPVPEGSCVVTGKLSYPLTITGNETEDIEVVLGFSINNSFEWKDDNGNGKFDIVLGEQVVDMGLRGLYPFVK